MSPKSNRSLTDLSYEVDETPDAIIQWVESNLGMLKTPEAISDAYQAISRGDEYLGRTFKTQYYTMWRYATAVMLLGVKAHACGDAGFMKIMPPGRWKRMSSAKRLKSARVELLSKLGQAMHMASYTVRGGYIMPVSLMAQREPLRYSEVFSLDVDQLDLLIQDLTVAKSTIKQIEDKRKAIERDIKKRQKDELASAKRTKKTTGNKLADLPLQTDGVITLSSVNISDNPDFSKDCLEMNTMDKQSEKVPLKTSKKDDKNSEKSKSQSTLFSFGG
jgi:replication factor C large subunit